MTLAEIKLLGNFQIANINLEHDILQRLASMGIMNGVFINIAQIRSKGPMIVEVFNNKFAISKNIASKIILKESKI